MPDASDLISKGEVDEIRDDVFDALPEDGTARPFGEIEKAVGATPRLVYMALHTLADVGRARIEYGHGWSRVLG